MTMKQELTKLKRENTRLHNANVSLNEVVNKQLEEDGVTGELRTQLDASRRECGKLLKASTQDRKDLANSENLVENYQAMCRTIQNDMKVVCEAQYGQEFDPQWYGDQQPNIYHNGTEYAPTINTSSPLAETRPTEYLEPHQRLLRMIWRRLHWGLNPIPYGRGDMASEERRW
jgi:hypothetical protein